MCRISLLTCRTTKKTYRVWNKIVRMQKSHKPIYSIHAVSGTRAIPRMVIDHGGGSCTWRRGRNLKSQSCEFGLDCFLTPEPVLNSHLSDEGLKVLGNRPSTNPSGACDLSASTNRHPKGPSLAIVNRNAYGRPFCALHGNEVRILYFLFLATPRRVGVSALMEPPCYRERRRVRVES
jgi:hypothetical protein